MQIRPDMKNVSDNQALIETIKLLSEGLNQQYFDLTLISKNITSI